MLWKAQLVISPFSFFFFWDSNSKMPSGPSLIVHRLSSRCPSIEVVHIKHFTRQEKMWEFKKCIPKKTSDCSIVRSWFIIDLHCNIQYYGTVILHFFEWIIYFCKLIEMGCIPNNVQIFFNLAIFKVAKCFWASSILQELDPPPP